MRDSAGREQPSRRAASVTVRAGGFDAIEPDGLAGMGGVGHSVHLSGLLVVINEIDIDRLAIAEPENDAQVAADAYAPVVGKGALKRVHAVARNVEIARAYRGVEVGQDAADPRDEMLR